MRATMRRHWHELAEIDRERDSERGERSGRDDEECAPAVEKRGERAEGVANVDVDATRLRAHGTQLGVGERAEEREQAASGPDSERDERIGAGVREDEPRHEEDPRADDDPDGGERQVEGAEQSGEGGSGGGRSRGDGRHGAATWRRRSGIPQRCTDGSRAAVVDGW